MSDAGYTLVEMLAAIAMISLAMLGLAEGLHTIERTQSRAAAEMGEGRNLRAVQRHLDGLLAGRGPFESVGAQTFEGAPDHFSFACGSARCGATLAPSQGGVRLTVEGSSPTFAALLPVHKAEFAYSGLREVTTRWPPADPKPDRLNDVSLIADGAPIATLQIWVEAPRRCLFDPIARHCRGQVS